VLPTTKVLPQPPIRPDVDVDDLEGVLARGFLVPHPEDQEPLPEGRAEREASPET
jgi:hypothetical protein